MLDAVAARKYAKALFAQATAQNQILACQQGLAEFVQVLRERAPLRGVLSHPFISADEKKRVIHSSFGEFATPLLERFLGMLVQKRRFDLFFVIAQEFQDEVDRSQNVQALRIRSAFPMLDAQQKALKMHLEKWLGSKVRMDVQVDPSLIGGLIIQTRDRVLDQSLKGQLKRLQAQLSA